MSHARGPLRDIQEFSDFSSDISLVDATNPEGARLLFIVDAGGGAISIVTGAGNTRVLTGFIAGNEIEMFFTRINSAGTTVAKIAVGF